MASLLRLHSGSVFNGNPIVFIVWPIALKETPSFHRMIFEVKCGMSGMSDGKYETIKMSEPINNEKGNPITVDISSALRSFRDSYEYSPNPGVMPLVKFNVSAYDEYMTDGEVKKSEPVYYLAGEDVKQTIFGGFSDYDRLMATNDTMPVGRMTRKPTTIPQLACVGETIIYVEPYSPAVDFTTATWEAPEAKAYNITAEGAQTVGGQQLFALPASEAARRTEFRFINSFGVLESISIPKSYAQEVDIKATNYIVTRKETLNSFSRSAVRKQGNMEGWNYMTDPLDEAWLAWYLHEFLMSEHVWLKINGKFLPCTIESEETIKYADDTKDDIYSVSFTARLSFCGSTKI